MKAAGGVICKCVLAQNRTFLSSKVHIVTLKYMYIEKDTGLKSMSHT